MIIRQWLGEHFPDKLEETLHHINAKLNNKTTLHNTAVVSTLKIWGTSHNESLNKNVYLYENGVSLGTCGYSQFMLIQNIA